MCYCLRYILKIWIQVQLLLYGVDISSHPQAYRNPGQCIINQSKKNNKGIKLLIILQPKYLSKQSIDNNLDIHMYLIQKYKNKTPQEMNNEDKQIENKLRNEAFVDQFFNEDNQRKAFNISSRIAELYKIICIGISNQFKENIQKCQWQEMIAKAYANMTYKDHFSDGPICRVNSQKLRYYSCFDCQLNEHSCICQICFNDGTHYNHRYRVIQTKDDKISCDCGDVLAFKRESFCKKHKNSIEITEIPKVEAELFMKQMQFLLYMSSYMLKFIAFQKKPIGDILLRHIYQMLSKLQSKSYSYQKLISQLLLSQFHYECFSINKENILQGLFQLQCSQECQGQFIQMLNSLYSIDKVKKKIIIYYLKRITSKETIVRINDPFNGLKVQFFFELANICRYIQNGRILPLSIYQTQVDGQLAGKFIFIYNIYDLMSKYPNYSQIIELSLQKMNISQLFSYHLIASCKDIVKLLSNVYLKILVLMIQSISTSQNTKSIYTKLIRQCCAFIKTKTDSFNFCAERTFSMAFFALKGHNLQNIRSMDIQEIMQLFDDYQLYNIKEMLQNMMESYFHIIKLENYTDYKDNVTDTRIEINKDNRIILSLDKLYVKIVVNLLSNIYRQAHSENFTPLQHFIITRQYMLERWLNLYEIQLKKKALIKQEQTLNQIKIILDTHLFIRIQDQLSADVIEVCKIINNMIFCLQSQLPEIIIANLLKNANKQKIMSFYRQYEMIKPECSKIQLKRHLQKLIDNQQLIKDYFTTEYHKNHELSCSSYVSNLSYSSLYFSQSVNQETTARFKLKMGKVRSDSMENSWIFNSYMHKIILKFLNAFVSHITRPESQFIQSSSLKLTLNLMVETFIILYLETKDIRYKELIQKICSDTKLNEFQEYPKYLMQIFAQQSEGNDAKALNKEEEDKDRKQLSKNKRDVKMKQMKDRQNRVLLQQKESSSPTNLETLHNKEQGCIICKTFKEEEIVNYLCFARFNNLLSKNIYQLKEPFVIITTCGHTIHESCLSKNINRQHEFQTNYKCFLCKQLSNLRVPLITNATQHRRSQINRFLSDFSTILVIDIADKKQLLKIQDKIRLERLENILFKTILYEILLFYGSYSRLYMSNMLPIANILLYMLKELNTQDYYHLKQTNQQLNNLKQNIVSIINRYEPKIQFLTFQEEKIKKSEIYEWKNELTKLYKYLQGNMDVKFQLIRNQKDFGFYNLPEDLVDLNKQIGECPSCKRITSKLIICFYCKLKLCTDCKQQLKEHTESHLGSIVTIDVENGRFFYRLIDKYVEFRSVYDNYIGECYEFQHGLPERGAYLLNHEKLDKIIQDAVRDSVPSIVEQEILKRIEHIPVAQNCEIQ